MGASKGDSGPATPSHALALRLEQATEIANECSALIHANRLDEAEQKLHHLHAVVFKELGAFPIDLLLNATLSLGFVASRRNDWHEAIRIYRKALAMARQEPGWFDLLDPAHTVLVPLSFDRQRATATVLTSLALAYDNSNQLAEAQQCYQEEIDIRAARAEFHELARVWLHIAIGAQRRRDWHALDQASLQILEALQGRKADHELELKALRFRAQASANLGSTTLAKSALKAAIALGRKMQDPRLEKDIELLKLIESAKS